jgi:hypothetical protein
MVLPCPGESACTAPRSIAANSASTAMRGATVGAEIESTTWRVSRVIQSVAGAASDALAARSWPGLAVISRARPAARAKLV